MKIAYVLSGGGAKGAYQVGVMKQLDAQGIKPDVIYGTSVGAINAAGYSFLGLPALEQYWSSVKGFKWYEFWTPSADILGFNWMNLLLGASDGLYNTGPMRKILDADCAGRIAVCEAVVAQTNINTGAIEYVSSKIAALPQFLDAVEGSSAIPGVMSPKNGIYVDGGVRQQVPLTKALADGGYDRIYVILCNPLTQDPIFEAYDASKQFPLFKSINIALRTVNSIMEHEVFVENCRMCFQNTSGVPLTVYAPPTIPCDTLQFDPKIVPSIIQMGYTAVPIQL